MTAEDPIDEAWDRLQGQWEDAEAHRKFIGLCATFDQLPEAGRRYRRVRDDDPDSDRRAMAATQIDRILGFAMKSLEAGRAPPPARTGARRLVLLVAAALAIAMIGLTGYLVLQ